MLKQRSTTARGIERSGLTFPFWDFTRLFEIIIVLFQILRTDKNRLFIYNCCLVLENAVVNASSWAKERTDLLIKCHGKRVGPNLAPTLNPAYRDNKASITKGGNFVNVIMCCSIRVHGAQNIEVHIFAPLLCVPDLRNNPVFWDFGIHMDHLTCRWVCPVLRIALVSLNGKDFRSRIPSR